MIDLYNNKYAQKQKEFSSFVLDRLGPDDPVLTFDCLIKEVNLEKYLDSENDSNLGRPAYNKIDMLKTILFAFMDTGFASLREIEDRCKSNIRYMFLMNCETPSYRTFGYFIKNLNRRLIPIYRCEMNVTMRPTKKIKYLVLK